MSAWQLLSADGGDYRWELAGGGGAVVAHPTDQVTGAPAQSRDSASRLPSMSDLLLQGRSKLLDNDGCLGFGSSPLFRTGLGKSVALKPSSIAKASCVLGDDIVPRTGHLIPEGRRTGSNSLFQTGSGKTVKVSPAGLIRAKTLLGLEEDDERCASQVLGHSKRTSSHNNAYTAPNSLSLENDGASIADVMEEGSISAVRSTCQDGTSDNRLKRLPSRNCMQPKMPALPAKPAHVKFQTAGGRSISISTDALRRAKSLLGEPELGSFLDEGTLCNNQSNKENEPPIPLQYQGTPNSTDVTKSFVSPLLHSSSNGERSLNFSKKIKGGSNLIAQFEAAAGDGPHRFGSDLGSSRSPLMGRSYASVDPTVMKNCDSRNDYHDRRPGQVLMDISNINSTKYSRKENNTCEKGFGGKSYISPFKRPRSSKFSTPLKKNCLLAPSGSSKPLIQAPSKGRVSTRYPDLLRRLSMEEYFGRPPLDMQGSPDRVGAISSHDAGKFMFPDESGLNCVGVEAFFQMLVQSGASARHLSEKWVSNHYRWIVWKLACYDRCYPAKTRGKFLTISNVLEELKYRYEREVNHGHRSAIKKILEGDALPSSMLVLCVSAICLNCDLTTGGSSATFDGNNNKMKVQLTDGWYSVDAVLDAFLSNHCNTGKVFIGQKLRILGAGLCGWAAPVSPLEATETVALLLHANGTYRAHWADRLGFCKGHSPPLAFNCIKDNGGPVPQTLIGVMRIYPILYRERLSDGSCIVRSERMELEIRHRHNQRRSAIIDGVVSTLPRSEEFHLYNESDSEDGAKISKLLEAAAEPELLMAEMNADQLNAYTAYRSKMEATRQSHTEKSIENALRNAGLSEREVTPLMRVKVVGLRSKTCRRSSGPEKGLITIWNPTERQQHDLLEGQAYVFTGLIPVHSPEDILYLHAQGPATKWRPLTSQEILSFRPFSDPRKAIPLSRLDEVSFSSEFDMAGVVVYVGEAVTVAHEKKQWVFVTDSSSGLLAINFGWPCVDDLAIPIKSNLVGSTVGFCNLIKRSKDQVNQLWVADATENSTYSLTFNSPRCCHLRGSAVSTQEWAKISGLTINKLRERVLVIIGESGV